LLRTEDKFSCAIALVALDLDWLEPELQRESLPALQWEPDSPALQPASWAADLPERSAAVWVKARWKQLQRLSGRQLQTARRREAWAQRR
jgi:hypothetical protein